MTGRDDHRACRTQTNHRVRKRRRWSELFRQAYSHSLAGHGLCRGLGEIAGQKTGIVPHEHAWGTLLTRFRQNASRDRPSDQADILERHVGGDDSAPAVGSEANFGHEEGAPKNAKRRGNAAYSA
jgi:hypothetical protein